MVCQSIIVVNGCERCWTNDRPLQPGVGQRSGSVCFPFSHVTPNVCRHVEHSNARRLTKHCELLTRTTTPRMDTNLPKYIRIIYWIVEKEFNHKLELWHLLI
jgi:hypothetical protein